MPIYTKTGDKGETSLFGGKRVLKSDELVDVYGTVDELNSSIGVIVSLIDVSEKKEFLQKIQGDLFTIGGNLAGWKTELSFITTRVTEMEVEIDVMESNLSTLTNFILPGGSQVGAMTHVTRSLCRRVERQVVALSQTQEIDGEIIQYLNRLSDLFFVLSRFINKKANVPEVIWSGMVKKVDSI